MAKKTAQAKAESSGAEKAVSKKEEQRKPAPVAKPSSVPPPAAEYEDSDEEDMAARADGEGYDGSDVEEDDNFEPEGPAIVDNDDDYDEDQKPFVPPAGLNLEKDESEDTLMLIAGGGGMFLCMAFAAVLPKLGVPAEHVMVGGMLALLGFIMYIMFFPSCGRPSKRKGSPIDDVTPMVVFVITGCIGTMLGGMFGGVYANMQ